MSDEAFTDMCNAFQRLIDAHCQSKSPFHNPVNADAMVALRILRALRAQLAAAEVPMQCGWYQDGDEESTTWQTSCGAYFTLNEGTPSDNRFSFCYSCGKHIVEYPIDEDAALRGEVKS